MTTFATALINNPWVHEHKLAQPDREFQADIRDRWGRRAAIIGPGA